MAGLLLIIYTQHEIYELCQLKLRKACVISDLKVLRLYLVMR